MYIEPNSVIHLLSGVPLDNKYNHTLWFADATKQSAYFGTKLVKSFRQCTYQRENRGWFRVGSVDNPMTPDKAFNVNYCMFQNTAFGKKWFYAFVTSVEYVNNTVAKFNYEIDVMQTWLFDYTLKESYIERQHTETDEPFEHTMEENVELGDYQLGTMGMFDMNQMNVCIATSKAMDGETPDGRIINGVFTPLAFSVNYNVANDVAEINAYLDNIVGSGQEDIIVNMYQYPKWIYDNMEKPSDVTGASTGSYHFDVNTETLIGYRPVNKKLFSYPFNFMRVSNNVGKVSDYRYEDFTLDENGFGKFELKGCIIPTPCVFMYPTDYKYHQKGYDYGMTISEFPTCPITGDVYKAYMAQNSSRNVTANLVGTLGATFAGGLHGGLGGAIVGASVGVGTFIANSVAQKRDMERTPPQVHGQTQCDGLNTAMKRVGFSFYRVCVKPEYAKLADDYFTMFGYSIKRVGVPNRTARPHYTYIQTIGCNMVGNMPADDIKKTCEIFDKGITFWKYPNEVGNYHDIDNTPA